MTLYRSYRNLISFLPPHKLSTPPLTTHTNFLSNLIFWLLQQDEIGSVCVRHKKDLNCAFPHTHIHGPGDRVWVEKVWCNLTFIHRLLCCPHQDILCGWHCNGSFDSCLRLYPDCRHTKYLSHAPLGLKEKSFQSFLWKPNRKWLNTLRQELAWKECEPFFPLKKRILLWNLLIQDDSQ